MISMEPEEVSTYLMLAYCTANKQNQPSKEPSIKMHKCTSNKDKKSILISQELANLPSPCSNSKE